MKKKKDTDDGKLAKTVAALEHALSFVEKAKKDEFYFAGIAKSFESCLEYAWRFLKRQVEAEGLEAVSPKEAIKLAGKIGWIADVELWLDFLEDRNLAVHDYLGLSNEEYLETIQRFLAEAKRLVG